jgi:hypothetical protein
MGCCNSPCLLILVQCLQELAERNLVKQSHL